MLRWLGLALLFGLGAIGSTWPLASDIDQGIPLGTEAVATVPLFNLWTLAWNVESLHRGYEGYWQAPIFHPATDTFALSEPQPVAGLVAAAITGLGGSNLVAYNLILISALALNGLLAAALFRQAGMRWLPAITGGALVVLLPFTHQELGVLQLVPLAGVLLFALAVLRFACRPGLGAGAGVGAGLALAYGLSAQIAVFTALAAAPAILCLWWPHRRCRRAWGGVAVGAGLFLLFVSPLVINQMRATADAGFTRSTETVLKQSAQPTHYLTSPWPTLVPTPGIEVAEKPSGRAFWPGTLRVLMAFAGLVLAWSRPRWRRLAVAGATLLLSSVLWSFGAHLGIGDLSLLDALRPIPGLAQIRSFFRFALLAQLAVVGLSAGALQLLLERTEGFSAKWWSRLLVASAVVLVLLDLRPTMGPIEPVPPLSLELPWVSWVERETTANEVLAFVPFPQGRSARAYLGTSQWMYWQMRHWRPMVNGYSGFFPATFRSLKKSMETFPAPEALQALHDAGVRYCIVHRRLIENSPPPDPHAPIQLVPAFRDEQHGLAIFELRG
ncbi:MAG: hypothetical protein K0U98_26805 [Deltaproteobacteria bacterium]|nr:hypothetical protein [Deltaproteobacteria bacterium]